MVIEANPLLFAGLFGVGGVLLVVFGFRNAKQRMVIRDYPTSRIRSMAMGPVEVKGDAESAGRTLTSPLSRKDCLGYRYKVEERRRRTDSEGNTEYEWVTIEDETRTLPFYVDDGTDRVLVDADRADVNLKESHEVDTGRIEKGLLYRLYEWIRGLFGYEARERYPEIPDETLEEIKNPPRRRRHSEYYIGLGESVYVFGEAMRSEDAEWADANDARGSAAGEGLLGTFTDSVGIGSVIPGVGGSSSEAGWTHDSRDDVEGDADSAETGDGGGKSVFERVAEIMGGSTEVDDVLRKEDVIISRGRDTPMFLISDYSEKNLARKKMWGSLLLVVVGMGMLVAAFGVLVVSFG